MVKGFCELISSIDFRRRTLDTLGEQNNDIALARFPNELYRYRNLSEYSINTLLKNHIALSSHLFFNDIFDSRIHNVKSSSYDFFDEHRKKLERLVVRYKCDNLANFLRIGNFCEVNNSTLMWSHYTNSHRGFCLQYNFNDLQSDLLKKLFFPVIYRDTPYDVTNLLEDYDTRNYNYEVELAILISSIIKSNDWSYEKEWRIIFGATDLQIDKFIEFENEIKPTKIFLGSKILHNLLDDSSTALLGRLINYMSIHPIKVYYMTPKIGTFIVEPQLLNLEKFKRLYDRVVKGSILNREHSMDLYVGELIEDCIVQKDEQEHT